MLSSKGDLYTTSLLPGIIFSEEMSETMYESEMVSNTKKTVTPDRSTTYQGRPKLDPVGELLKQKERNLKVHLEWMGRWKEGGYGRKWGW